MGQGCSNQCYSFLPQTFVQPKSDTTLIIGGGIAGLVAAYSLVRRGKAVEIVEERCRFGGQIESIEFQCYSGDDHLIIEQGAEGFVSRSEAIPKIARELGIEGDMISQGVYDNMTFENGELRVLPQGESARRLGFQVDKQHLGAGLKTFRRGLGHLVRILVGYLAQSRLAKLTLNCSVQSVFHADETLLVMFQHYSPKRYHSIIAACPAKAICRIFCLELSEHKAHSNLNVNLVYQGCPALRDEVPRTTGFSIPEADQEGRLGLRAVSFMSWKFPEQVGSSIVFRAHFRPRSDDVDAHVVEAKRAIADALPNFAGESPRVWACQWTEALVECTEAFKDSVSRAEKHLADVYQGRIQLAGSSIGHAGVDGAVVSGIAAVDRLASACGW